MIPRRHIGNRETARNGVLPSRFRLPAGIVLCLLAVLIPWNGWAQEAAPPPPANENIQSILILLSNQSETTWKELEELNRLPQTKRVQEKKEELLSRLDGINRNFENIATRLQTDDLDAEKKKKGEWFEQVEALTKPLLDALSEVTAKPRRIEALKKRIEDLKNQLQQIENASRNIERLMGSRAPEDSGSQEQMEAYRQHLKKLKQKYDPELVRLNLEEAQRALEVETANTEPLMDTATQAIQKFFKTRGRNLLITTAIFVSLWWVLMRLRTLIAGRKKIFNLPSWMNKVLMTVYSILVLLFCIISSMVTLYILNDWLLLSIVILFLIAVAWASRQLIPRMFQEVRLAMNLGTVKEHERLIWCGVPWRVESIGLQATLVNKRLQGGTVQLPVGELVGKHSRPVVENEPWFPTETGDWVILSDNTYGQVKNQTLEQVVLLLKGSTRKYYSTGEFLALTPQNISKGFRYEIRFGFDYSLQAELCDRIPEIFIKGLPAHLPDYFDTEDPDIRTIEIAFDHAGGSGLVLRFLIDVDGRQANRYLELQNEIQNVLIRLCNEHDLKIPVSQLALNLPGQLPGIQPPPSPPAPETP
ncbi:MAG: hypothetical protein KC553_09930 [Nitrospina sp.]|nr:hypothetical protein [Nitrospina sp.]